MDELLTLRATPEVEKLTTRAAPMGASTTLDEATRSIDYTLVTENMATVYAPEIDEVIDEVIIAAGVEWPESVRLLADHNKYDIDKVRGSVRDFRRLGSEIVGRAFFAEDSDSEKAWIKVKGGHLPNISAGYRVIEATYINPGETMVVAGRSWTARSRTLRIATRVMMREDSLVAVPADQFATTRHAPPTTNRGTPASKDPVMNKFLAWLKLKGKDNTALTDTERAALKTEFITERKALGDMTADGEGETDTERSARKGNTVPPAPTGADADTIRAAAEKAAKATMETERARVAAIEDLAGKDDFLVETCRQAIREGWDTDRAAKEFLKKTRESRGATVSAPNIHVHSSGTSADVLGMAMTLRSGVDPLPKNLTETERTKREQLAEKANKYRSLSMLDVCRHAIICDGKSVPASEDDTIRSAVSGGTLTNIFTQAINARVEASYVEQGDSTADWCREADVRDFKTNDRMRVGEAGNLTRHTRGGKADHDNVSDSKVSYKIARYSKQFSIDEQDIIDDNFGKLTEHGTEMGSAAKRLRPDLVYSILMSNPTHDADGIDLFHASHSNLLTGGASALSSTSLKLAVTQLAKQTGVTVEVILNLLPKLLVTGPDLMFTAMELLRSIDLRPGGFNASSDMVTTYNALGNLGIMPRQEQRISSGFVNPVTKAAVAGSATRWFLIGDRAACPTIEVGYRIGTNRAPVLRSWTMDKDGQFGIGFDVKHDIGAKAIDYKNMQRSNGV